MDTDTASGLPFNVGVTDLLDAGLHFGHQSKRWNPKMKRFIFDKRNGIYIIDLTKTLAQLKEAQQFLYQAAASGKGILFVGTKKQCQDILKDAVPKCGQHYIISRWLGGTLTNQRYIGNSIRRMRQIEELDKSGELASMPQKEASRLRHELTRLQRNLSGISNMMDAPGAMVVIDINRESNAVKEANRIGIPVVALVDTNCDPDLVTCPIPGNDDAIRGIRLIINTLTEAITKGTSDYAVVAAARQASRAADEKDRPASSSSGSGSDESPRRDRSKSRTGGSRDGGAGRSGGGGGNRGGGRSGGGAGRSGGGAGRGGASHGAGGARRAAPARGEKAAPKAAAPAPAAPAQA